MQVRLRGDHEIWVHFNVKLSDSVVVFLVRARNENRAELDEDVNSLGSGLFVSRIGRPRGFLQTQSFINLEYCMLVPVLPELKLNRTVNQRCFRRHQHEKDM
jgi:hypothetical protein